MTNLPLSPRSQPLRHPFHIMTRRPPPQRPRNLLERPSRRNALGLLDASLQSTDLELARGHVRGDIQLAGRGERGVGGLGGEGAGIKGFGTFAVGGGLEVRRFLAIVGGNRSHGAGWCSYVCTPDVRRCVCWSWGEDSIGPNGFSAKDRD